MSSAAMLFWCGLGLALAYLGIIHRRESGFRSAAKTAPLVCFALAAFLANAPVFLTAALVFSALGDLALSRSGRAAFLYGLSSFALAHLMFILVFQGLGDVAIWQAFARNTILAVILLGLAASTEIWLAPHTGSLVWPVRIYVTLITLMGLAALALPGGFGVVVLGAALFIASDMILSIRLFRLAETDPRRRLASVALWISYIAGQALIVSGITTL